MKPKTTKKPNELQKRPYKKKYKCKNPDHNGFTDSPAYHSGKIYCQKCTLFKKEYGRLPTKEDIRKLKSVGRWKN